MTISCRFYFVFCSIFIYSRNLFLMYIVQNNGSAAGKKLRPKKSWLVDSVMLRVWVLWFDAHFVHLLRNKYNTLEVIHKCVITLRFMQFSGHSFGGGGGEARDNINEMFHDKTIACRQYVYSIHIHSYTRLQIF